MFGVIRSDDDHGYVAAALKVLVYVQRLANQRHPYGVSSRACRAVHCHYPLVVDKVLRADRFKAAAHAFSTHVVRPIPSDSAAFHHSIFVASVTFTDTVALLRRSAGIVGLPVLCTII